MPVSRLRKPVRVIIVDDSALIRKVLTEILGGDPGIEVIATAGDPLIARKKIRDLNPDVVTLDIEMPRLDGLSFLDRIMRLRPMPVVMVSTFTERGSDIALEALEMGAVDALPKPKIDIRTGLTEGGDELIAVVKAAAEVSTFKSRSNALRDLPRKVVSSKRPPSGQVIGIGASTGGVYALHEVVGRLPQDTPPILIVQHMTGSMIAKFTQRLNENSRMNVVLATDGVRLLPGHAYVAPYGCHMKLARSGLSFAVKLTDEAPVMGHRPAVDPLFQSMAEAAGPAGIGVILTGMGRDGASGLLSMKNAGALTIGQDERTSLIYGMPKVAKSVGAVEHQLPLNEIADKIVDLVGRVRLEEAV